jgi:hypothetical protein
LFAFFTKALTIPILLLYECNITKGENELTEGYKNTIISCHRKKANKYFKKQINKMRSIFKYSDIQFHLVCGNSHVNVTCAYILD